MMQNKIKIIGIMGNSGSGKSSVCRILENKGAYIIDADKIAHEVIEQEGAAYGELVDFFGVKILDENKNIIRKKLGTVVFSDEEKRKILMNITHKYILEEMYARVELAQNSEKYQFIVLDAPLLVEANLHNFVDEVWLVYAEEETRLSRIISRDNLTREQAELRLKSQTPFEELREFADIVIYNEENIGQLENQVNKRLVLDSETET